MNAPKPPIIYVDVDDTFVRSVGTKRIPMPAMLRHIRALKERGATLYCWSSGGADYARASAAEFGVEDCFVAFLPKPQVLIEVLIDDQNIGDWRDLRCVHPASCDDLELDECRLVTRR